MLRLPPAHPAPSVPLRSALAEATDLLVPASCPACGAAGAGVLCAECTAELAAELSAGPSSTATLLRDSRGDPLPVHAGSEFRGVSRRLVLALKEEGRRAAATPLAGLLVPALSALVAAGIAAEGAVGSLEIAVPPASYARRVRRGLDPVRSVVWAAGASSVAPLVRVRRTRDQAGLGREERAANLDGAFRARRSLAGRRFVLVDDVVTTGSTLVESRRALQEAGALVVGAAVLTRTPARIERHRSAHSGP